MYKYMSLSECNDELCLRILTLKGLERNEGPHEVCSFLSKPICVNNLCNEAID